MPLLYHLWLSPFSRKVRIVLGEKGEVGAKRLAFILRGVETSRRGSSRG